MGMTVQELAQLIGGVCDGDGDIIINGIAGIRDAVKGQLTFVTNSRYLSEIENTHASAIIIPHDTDISFRPVIRATQPKLALIKAIAIFIPPKDIPASLSHGVHELAYIGNNVSLGENVRIGPFAVIEDGSIIKDNTIISPSVYIGSKSQIGSDCYIFANVSIQDGVIIGDRVIIHSGTVIGCDGFGYAEIESKHHKIPQSGNVVIEDDVEIGANVSIDRATFGKTWIKKGTKIDNLVQIAHNVVIGENCIIVAQGGIAGSTEIGDRVTLAGQVAVTGHIKIGADTIVTGRSAVSKSIPSNVCVSGQPAKLRKENQRILAHLQRLPHMSKRILQLEEKIETLYQFIDNNNNSEKKN